MFYAENFMFWRPAMMPLSWGGFLFQLSQDQVKSKGKPPFHTEKKERIDSSGNILKLPQTFS